jgi:hypothetical protein
LVLDSGSNDLVVDRALTPSEIAAITGLTGTLKDDDPTGGQLPFYPSMTPFIKGAFAHAYVDIVAVDAALNLRPTVAFELNLTDFEAQVGHEYDNHQDVFSSAEYWAALLVAGYQGNDDDDEDGDFDRGDNGSPQGSNLFGDEYIKVGITVEDSDNASVVFLEVIRDYGPIQGKDLDHTIAHEIGHSAGANTPEELDHAELGIMATGAPIDQNQFTAKTLKRFREANPW